MTFARSYGLSVLMGFGISGCGAQATAHMRRGEPLDVRSGACFVRTSYVQDGEELNWNTTVAELSTYEESRPHLSRANAWAIGSWGATAVGVTGWTIGAMAKSEGVELDMDEGLATGLLVGGILVTVGGFILCVVSDAEYANAAYAYNKRITGKEQPLKDAGTPAPEAGAQAERRP